MPIQSRWMQESVPNVPLHTWVFGSCSEPISTRIAFLDAEKPDTHFLTFTGYRLLAKQIAAGLRNNGIQPGDRVLVFSNNHIFFPALFMGILMTGAIFTGANPNYTPRELAHQLNDSGASMMLAGLDIMDTALKSANETSLPVDRVFSLDTTRPGLDKPNINLKARHWTELVASEEEGQSFKWFEPEDARHSTCCLNYSSGTTGLPKGVEISHYSYVANGCNAVKVARLGKDYEQERATSISLCFLPLYHAYGQTYFVANLAQQGVPVYIMEKFDFVKMLTHIQQYSITQLLAVPPVLVALVKHPAARKYDLSSLRTVGSGAAPLPPDVARETERMLAKDDLIVRQGWGMTELTCTAMSWHPDSSIRTSSVGELMPNCSAKLVNEQGSEITTSNTPGEIWIAGPTLMRGYWRNSEATSQTITEEAGERWLRTGDIAYVESYEPGGIFHIVDRRKELIKVKGNQVAPAELEALLLESPDISDAAVIGVTIQGDEFPRAYIVKAPGSSASEMELAKWLEGKVARYKRLGGGVKFIDSIPRNPVSPDLAITSQPLVNIRNS